MISLRSGAIAALAVVFLVLHLRLHSKVPTARLLKQGLKSQIEHGVHLQPSEGQRSIHNQEYNESRPAVNQYMQLLIQCPIEVNKHTYHIRLESTHLRLDFDPSGQHRLFNPALLPLPAWSTSGTYLVVSRVVTEGLHQESLICLAELCLPPNSTTRHPPGSRPCTIEDEIALGNKGGGLRCRSEPMKLNIPPTPALHCEGSWSSFPDIPGFHDPRIFWSGKGEPLIILNSASQYSCLGLWITDLRTLYPEFEKMVNRHGKHSGPAMSYHHLTEITRNPRNSRASVEKNWMLWFPGDDGEAYVQYDLGSRSTRKSSSQQRSLNQTMLEGARGRTFAKLIGNGFTTTNLTSPYESSCFDKSHNYDSLHNLGHWHQGSNSLRLILCTRSQIKTGDCGDAVPWSERSVHFAIMHRKFSNEINLPMRYERFVAVWEGRPPFRMLGVSKFPFLMHDEWARPWSETENWPEEHNRTGNWTAQRGKRDKSTEGPQSRSDAYFTYTPSLAWAWRPRTEDVAFPGHGNWGGVREDDVRHLSQLGTGYLGDEVLVGIGLDDVGQAFARVKVDELVSCLRLCADIRTE